VRELVGWLRLALLLEFVPLGPVLIWDDVLFLRLKGVALVQAWEYITCQNALQKALMRLLNVSNCRLQLVVDQKCSVRINKISFFEVLKTIEVENFSSDLERVKSPKNVLKFIFCNVFFCGA